MKRFFLGNISMKIAALGFSVILWLFVTSKGQTEISMNVPIEYTNIPSGLEISRHIEKSASIVIRGNESILKNIRQGSVRVYMDVSKAKKGEALLSIRKDDVRLPGAVRLIKIEPSSVRIFFEETASRKVPVKPVVTGSPESGYYVRSVSAAPTEVLIEGAKSEVAKVGVVKTEPIDITGMTGELRQETGLDISGSNIRLKIERVNVQIKISRRNQ